MEEKPKTYKIEIEGVVQGVGFRPFIYNLAIELKLKGFVRNTKKGVSIEVTGFKDNLETFLKKVETSSPPLSLIKSIFFVESNLKDFNTFEIIASSEKEESNIFLSPDVSVCNDCLSDFSDITSRYYQYPFVNCTNCGPRFSIILDYPYDRKNTTMGSFVMCPQCEKEYKDISSRRYHAQPISCQYCGPTYKLYDNNLREVHCPDIFTKASELLSEGYIIAVKGVGGYHLVLSATNIATVKKLRERKKRDRKPFAMLFRDIELVKEYAYVSTYEEEVLKGKEKPILLLKKKKEICQGDSQLISGNSPYYGVMLPYAPFHHLLLDKNPILICTSANISGEPIVFKEEDLARITSLADYFLIHNRDIERFVEDSVVKVIETPFQENDYVKILFRKSRGYAPSPLFLKRSFNKKIMALGADLKSTISILKDDALVQSQYIGDLSDYESYIAYQKAIEDTKRIYDFEPDIYVCDIHPNYLSTRFAEKLSKDKPLFKVQHHKAHIASVCLENNFFEEPVVGIALDGTGYGEDGMIWGGEVFLGSLMEGFKRVGHLSYIPFPFGDVAVKDPERSYLCYLYSIGIVDERLFHILSVNTRNNIGTLKKIIDASKIYTSSTGRFFDCVSYLLGFRKKISFEGEAAVELENLIYKKFSLDSALGIYPYNLTVDEPYIIDVKEILKNLFKDFLEGVEKELISLKFHLTLVAAFTEVAKTLCKNYSIKKIVLSGGSFQNSYLLYNFIKQLKEAGLTPYINKYSPPNDACISVGQGALTINS